MPHLAPDTCDTNLLQRLPLAWYDVRRCLAKAEFDPPKGEPRTRIFATAGSASMVWYRGADPAVRVGA